MSFRGRGGGACEALVWNYTGLRMGLSIFDLESDAEVFLDGTKQDMRYSSITLTCDVIGGDVIGMHNIHYHVQPPLQRN